jgi:hypothetical protein
MSVLRRIIVVVAGAALLVGLTASPLEAGGAGKIYSVTVSPATLPYSPGSVGPVQFTVVFTNQTPGNSQFNSLALGAPAGFTISGPVTAKASSGNLGNASIASTASGIQVTNLYPVGYGQTLTVTFYATVDTSNLSCATAAGLWSSQAFTGSNLSGTPFTLTGNAPTTAIGTPLASGASVTVNGVTVTNNGAACVPVTITRNGNSVNVQKPTSAADLLTVDILWNPEPAASPLPWTQVSDTFNPTLHNIEWCGGTVGHPQLPGDGEVSCLVSESSQIAGSNTVQVHDVINLVGDWGAQR